MRDDISGYIIRVSVVLLYAGLHNHFSRWPYAGQKKLFHQCQMSVVGSLIFCVDCGNLLDSKGADKYVTCDSCLRQYDAKAFTGLKVLTKSHEDAFPSSLRLKKSAVKTLLSKDDQSGGNGATIEETCPKCGNEEMTYHTLQLRSADEGATVFYTCTSCGYRYRTNN